MHLVRLVWLGLQGEHSLLAATAYLTMGQIETELGNYEEALRLCKKSAEIRESFPGNEHDAACARSAITVLRGLPHHKSAPGLLVKTSSSFRLPGCISLLARVHLDLFFIKADQKISTRRFMMIGNSSCLSSCSDPPQHLNVRLGQVCCHQLHHHRLHWSKMDGDMVNVLTRNNIAGMMPPDAWKAWGCCRKPGSIARVVRLEKRASFVAAHPAPSLPPATRSTRRAGSAAVCGTAAGHARSRTGRGTSSSASPSQSLPEPSARRLQFETGFE